MKQAEKRELWVTELRRQSMELKSQLKQTQQQLETSESMNNELIEDLNITRESLKKRSDLHKKCQDEVSK